MPNGKHPFTIRESGGADPIVQGRFVVRAIAARGNVYRIELDLTSQVSGPVTVTFTAKLSGSGRGGFSSSSGGNRTRKWSDDYTVQGTARGACSQYLATELGDGAVTIKVKCTGRGGYRYRLQQPLEFTV